MQDSILISGGGIGGLAAALGAAHAGWRVCLVEQSARLEEVGAGIQLSPNVMRRLQHWRLSGALAEVVALPQSLCVRSGIDGRALASMPLHPAMQQRYGASYATIHRADLQQILLRQMEGRDDICLKLAHRAEGFSCTAGAVTLHCAAGQGLQAGALVIADGVRSALRAQCRGAAMQAAALFSGQCAWRALVRQAALPQNFRTDDVTLWLGQGLHAVQYPVRRGEWQNLVIVTEAASGHSDAGEQALWHALRAHCAHLRDLAGHVCAAGGAWRPWPLHVRAPLSSAREMAQHRVALLGDAAHPMLPFLAQGAGMAIEDAHALQICLAREDVDVPRRFALYAQMRWRRCARVQAQAQRNAHIFHAAAPLRWGRDAALRLLGPRLLDQPWLYAG